MTGVGDIGSSHDGEGKENVTIQLVKMMKTMTVWRYTSWHISFLFSEKTLTRSGQTQGLSRK